MEHVCRLFQLTQSPAAAAAAAATAAGASTASAHLSQCAELSRRTLCFMEGITNEVTNTTHSFARRSTKYKCIIDVPLCCVLFEMQKQDVCTLYIVTICGKPSLRESSLMLSSCFTGARRDMITAAAVCFAHEFLIGDHTTVFGGARCNYIIACVQMPRKTCAESYVCRTYYTIHATEHRVHVTQKDEPTVKPPIM